MQRRYTIATFAVLAMSANALAQSITEIAAPTVPMSVIDFDTMPLGPTTVAAVNAAGVPPAGISNILLTPSTAAAGVFNTNPGAQALGFDGTGLVIVDGLGAAPFASFDAQFDLAGPSTEIGFGVGDWNGPMIIDFYLANSLVTTYTSTAYSATSLFKYYQMNNGQFDRINVRCSTTAGNFVFRQRIEVQVLTGLYASFSATPTSGNSPLTVQFTSTSFTSDPGGIVAWLWDLDGDNIVDSAMPNPSFTYGCGSYTVSLQVFDAAHPPASLTRNNFIDVDPLDASFTSAVVTGSTYQFTDTSSPTPQAWLWDLDGDNVTDSVLQNPTFTYPVNCTTYNVTLTAILNCRIATATTSIAVAPAIATAVPFTGGNGTAAATVGNLFDMQVTAPEGITVCAIEQGIYTYVGPFTANIYVTENTYVGKNTNAAAWRLVGTGSGFSNGGALTPATPYRVPMNAPFYLPAGGYGVAVFLTQPAGTMNISYTNGPQGPFVNTDVTFFPTGGGAGESQVGLFTGTAFTPRCWNGNLHYTKTSISQTAGFGYMNSGCASSLGVSRVSISGLPRIGQNSTINVDNMPQSVGILAIGFSRTTSVFGPLPADLTGFGLPGCRLFVSPDVLSPLVGAGNTAGFTALVPNSPSVIGTLFYSQALVNDPAANTFGGVVSDAACGIVGQ